MASAQKISELTTAGPLTGAELVPIVQNGGTLQTTVSVLSAYAIVSLLPVVSALGTQIANVSAQIGVQTSLINALSNDVTAVEIQLAQVSALTSVNTAAITSVNNVVSALEIRVSAASATGAANTAALVSTNNVVSALEIRVSTVSARASALDVRLTAVSASVSVLQIQINNVSAALTSTNNVVSALEIRVSAVSAQAAALDVRVAAVSASVSVINARLPSGTVVGTTDTQTLTNKRVNPRVFTTTTGVSLTPDISQFEIYAYTALASDLTINAAVSGTPLNGNRLIFRIEDNGVSRALTWATAGTNAYRQVGATLPTATSAGRVTYVGCLYNEAELFWDVLAVATQA